MPLTPGASQLPQVPETSVTSGVTDMRAESPGDHAAAIRIILSAVTLADFCGHNNSSRARRGQRRRDRPQLLRLQLAIATNEVSDASGVHKVSGVLRPRARKGVALGRRR